MNWLAAAATALQLLDLNGRPVDPLQTTANVKAVVFVFTATDCPISNRYAPEVQRLHREFAAKGVRFWLVYPNPAESADAIRAHGQSFGYPADALRDPKQQLVKMAKATVTPEAAVFVN